MDKDALLKRLDTAAQTLLNDAFPDNKGDGNPIPVEQQKSLVDKVKAFDAVRGWMSERAKLIPEDRKSGKGERLRNKFRSATAPSRRNRAGAAESDESEIDIGSDAGDSGLVSAIGVGHSDA